MQHATHCDICTAQQKCEPDLPAASGEWNTEDAACHQSLKCTYIGPESHSATRQARSTVAHSCCAEYCQGVSVGSSPVVALHTYAQQPPPSCMILTVENFYFTSMQPVSLFCGVHGFLLKCSASYPPLWLEGLLLILSAHPIVSLYRLHQTSCIIRILNMCSPCRSGSCSFQSERRARRVYRS